MSSLDEQDVSTLGKRARNIEDDEDRSNPNSQKPAIDVDESDDDVGPMPEPAEGSVITKKKRKGVSRFCFPFLG